MGKPKRDRAADDQRGEGAHRTIRISPQKLNLVAQLIRGKKVATALADLDLLPQAHRRATSRRRCESAIANAENNHQLDVDSLVVAEAHVGKSLVLKRWTPRAAAASARSRSAFRT